MQSADVRTYKLHIIAILHKTFALGLKLCVSSDQASIAVGTLCKAARLGNLGAEVSPDHKHIYRNASVVLYAMHGCLTSSSISI